MFTTGKPTYAECPDICRVHNLEHSAKILFAECQKTCTRRINNTRRTISLPSASHMALGKDTLCRVLVSWHSAKSVTCTNRRPADDRYGGDAFVCRVPYSRHSANAVTCTAPASSPRPLRCCHERSHFSTAVTVMLRRVPNWGTRQTYCNAECNGTGTRHLINFAECRLWHSANKYKNFLQRPPNFFLRSHTMWKTSYLNLANYPLCLLYLDYLFDYKNILCIIQIWTAKCCQKCW